ncbi:MAG: superoxide dismutase [Bacteroidota bacterium]
MISDAPPNRAPISRRQALRIVASGAMGAAVLPFVSGCTVERNADASGGAQEPSAAPSAVSSSSGVLFDLAVAAPGASLVYPYQLPDLPYATDALEAAIDAETMGIHHGRHHQGYTTKLNAALEDKPDLQSRPLLELLQDVSTLPEDVRTAVLNNGGGYLNHALFWPSMRPGGGGTPTGPLADAIARDFGSFDVFKEQFTAAALGVFGSGWAWLGRDASGTLQIVQTPEQEPAHAFGFVPVLGVDVWEHAYYLRYQNRRGDYLASWWDVVDWEQAARNLTA